MSKLFGTNGIRGVINEDMNTDLALGIGKAWGTYLTRRYGHAKVAVGTDARLGNHMLKNAVSAGLLSTGCDVVDAGVIPTPTLQYMVKEKGFDSGVIITASHNPPQFNGIKGVGEDGREFTEETELEIEEIYFQKQYHVSNWENVGCFSTWEGAADLYIEGVLKHVDVELVKKHGFHVVLDCGNGAGSMVTPLLLERLGCRVTKIFCTPDGRFPGRNSEPIPENLTELVKKVVEVNADFGVAQDGDADRAIFIDEKGGYIWGDKTLALAAKYVTQEKHGGVTVTPVTTSSCFDDVVRENQGVVVRTRVGSPTVARVMKEKNAVFGGEENGGLIFPEHQYCRDSAMAIAKIMEIIAREKQTLSGLISQIPRYEVYKTKLKCPNEEKNVVMRKIAEYVRENEDVVKIDETDGVKLYLQNGWVLIRPSGTEPIFRVYSESKNKEISKKIALKYKELTEDIVKGELSKIH